MPDFTLVFWITLSVIWSRRWHGVVQEFWSGGLKDVSGGSSAAWIWVFNWSRYATMLRVAQYFVFVLRI